MLLLLHYTHGGGGKLSERKPFGLSRAFTLAEVLITLGIIGIVAAMTIPTLIQKTQKQQTITALKKVYSSLQQAVKLSEVDNGSIEDWDFSTGSKVFLENYIISYVSPLKKCFVGSDICWNQKKNLNGSLSYAQSNGIAFILSDGTQVLFWHGVDFYEVIVDINGFKLPNQMGKDVFELQLAKTPATNHTPNLIFIGSNKTREDMIGAKDSNSCNKLGTGLFCGALIQQDGWEIKDDYPW
ncbi:type II secretion system protein [bacterium]|nr:type II secretion system protein [bacterium]